MCVFGFFACFPQCLFWNHRDERERGSIVLLFLYSDFCACVSVLVYLLHTRHGFFLRSGILVVVHGKYLKAGRHWPSSETPFEWRFAGEPMQAQHCKLPGLSLSYVSLVFAIQKSKFLETHNDLALLWYM